MYSTMILDAEESSQSTSEGEITLHNTTQLSILTEIKKLSENFNKISVIQRKVLRYMHFKYNMDQTTPILIQARILPIDKHLFLRNCLFGLQILQNDCPNYFKDFIKKSGQNRTCDTRSQRLVIIRTNTNTYDSCNIKNNITNHWIPIFQKSSLLNSI